MLNPYINYLSASLSERVFSVINDAADSDPELRQLLDELEGRRFRLRFSDIDRQIDLCVQDGAVFTVPSWEHEADLVIEGTVVAVMRMVFSRDRNPTRIEGVAFTGDVKLAQRLHQLLSQAEFDWEEMLAAKTGDIPARYIGNLLRWGRRNLAGSDSTLATKLHDTLVHQKQVLPTRERVEEFMDDVDTLQADADRLEKRIARLERRS